MKKIFFFAIFFCCVISASSRAAEVYESVYQLPLALSYCSSQSGGQYGAYPCTTSYLHTQIYYGFEDQWNPGDPKHRCRQDTTCPDDHSSTISYGLNLQGSSLPGGNLWRYYLPKGTTMVDLTLYGLPSAGAGATLARLGSPPTSKFPASFDQFNDLAKYPEIFPPTQYPDIRSFWSGKTIEQLKQNDWFAINRGGDIVVLVDSRTPLTEGSWLYINFNSYGGSGIKQHAFTWYADEILYTNWYDSYAAFWLANGDPSEQATPTPTPVPSLSVTPSNQPVTKDAGTTTFSVSNTGTGTMPWTAAVTPGSWLSIASGASGTGTGTITCSFTANTSSSTRTATIRVTASGATGSPKDVTVTQEATLVQPVLSVSPDNRDVAKDAGTTTFSISNTGTGTMLWTAAVTPGSWLSIASGASGTGTGTITCKFAANTSSSARTATIRVTASGATGSPKDVTVTQAPTPKPALSVTPAISYVAKDAGTVTFYISNTGTGTMPWTAAVTSGGTWLSITSRSSGKDAGTINCSFTANTSSSARTANIQVTASGATGSPKSVKVTQTADAFASPVPSTGQNKCYGSDGSVIDPCPSPGQPLYGQDANYSINPMSYTKLDSSGKSLLASATSWVMVRDNVTGLIWENKTNDGTIHDRNNQYAWYDSNPATNGGNAGKPGDGKNTEKFVKDLNDAKYGGYIDWRLPTIKELDSIVKYDEVEWSKPAIDTTYFPETQPSFYWSSVTNSYDKYKAWGVDFGNGYGYNGYDAKDGKFYVIAVRGGRSEGVLTSESFDAVNIELMDAALIDPGSYVDNGDGTVTDVFTGLMWQQENSDKMTWEKALLYRIKPPIKAVYTDWRLPTVKELCSLADYNRNEPAINTTFFPNAMPSFYWASTTNTYSPDLAWGVDFGSGAKDYYYKSLGYHVRLVRGGFRGPSMLVSNSIGSLNTIKISDISGSLPAGGGAIVVSAWDVKGNAIPESAEAVTLKLYNHETKTISGLAGRFSEVPMLYKFAINSSKVVITNVKNNTGFKVPIVYLNGVTQFASNSIGSLNTIKISDISGAITAGTTGSAISVKAWDAGGIELSESGSAVPLKLYNHGTTIILGKELAARFPGGSPMTYEFNVPSAKVLITNVKSSAGTDGKPDGKLNVPVAYTSGVSNFVSNSIDDMDALQISDLSGALPSGGGAVSVMAWDDTGNKLTELAGVAPLKLLNHGTTIIQGDGLKARFSGTPTTYEFVIGSSKVLITNVKSSTDDLVKIPSIFPLGISNYATNYVNGTKTTIKISDTSGTLSADGVAIRVAAWDINGNVVPESGTAVPLRLNNLGTTTISGSDLAARFAGVPVLYEFTIGSSNAIITSVTDDGTTKTPTVFTIGAFGGI